MADCYVSGSDMLWSSKLNKGHRETQFYLTWAPEDKPHIAYAASIGETELPPEERSFMLPLLKSYDRIGMREKSGVALLDSMGISSVNVLDPTLVLPSAFWESFASQCSSRKRPYLLVYFLHDHEEVFRQALAYARRQGFEVVRVAFHPLRKADDDKIEVIPSVEKLVSLFMNAEFVVTDSFHGTAFSLNFAKSFLVTQPPRFETRLDSILEIANAPQRVIRDSSVPFSAYGPIDYDHVTKALCREREKSRAFLNAALGD